MPTGARGLEGRAEDAGREVDPLTVGVALGDAGSSTVGAGRGSTIGALTVALTGEGAGAADVAGVPSPGAPRSTTSHAINATHERLTIAISASAPFVRTHVAVGRARRTVCAVAI